MKALSFAIVALALWFAINTGRLRDYFEVRGRRNENKRAVLDLERKISQMEAERAALQTFGFPAEKAIRERYRMRRPDEGVIYIDEPEDANKPVAKTERKAEAEPADGASPGGGEERSRDESHDGDSPKPSLP